MNRRGDAERTLLRGTGQPPITLGVVLLLFCVYELKVTNLVTARAQEQLADDLAAQWEAPRAAPPTAAPTPAAVAPVELGSGLAVLRIPRLGDTWFTYTHTVTGTRIVRPSAFEVTYPAGLESSGAPAAARGT